MSDREMITQQVCITLAISALWRFCCSFFSCASLRFSFRLAASAAAALLCAMSCAFSSSSEGPAVLQR